MRKGEVEMVRGTESEQVVEDVTGWVEVRRGTRRREVEEDSDEGGKSRKTVQIFAKIDGSRTIVVDVAQHDKVSDVMKPIPSGGDMSGGNVLRSSDKLRSYGVSDGCTIQVTSRMCGGGRHKDKKSKAERKQLTSEEPVSGKGLAILESEKDRVTQSVEEDERYRKIVEDVPEGSDVDVERKVRYWMSKLQERPGGDIMECAIRWAVEARRQGRGRKSRSEPQDRSTARK